MPADDLFQCLSTDCCSLCCPPYCSASSSMDCAQLLSEFDIAVVCRIASDSKRHFEIRFARPERPD